MPIYTNKENWPTICGSEQEIAIKKYYNLQTIHEVKISCEIFAIFHCSKWSHLRLSPLRPRALLYITQYTVHSVHWPSTHPPKLDPSSPPHPASGQPRHWARWLRGCEAEEDGGCRPRHKPPGRRTGPSLALTSGQTFHIFQKLIRHSIQGRPSHRVSGRSQASLSLNLGSNSDHS